MLDINDVNAISFFLNNNIKVGFLLFLDAYKPTWSVYFDCQLSLKNKI